MLRQRRLRQLAGFWQQCRETILVLDLSHLFVDNETRIKTVAQATIHVAQGLRGILHLSIRGRQEGR